jgi:hypothetical protein
MRNPGSALPWEASFCDGAAAAEVTAAADDLLLEGLLEVRAGIHKQFRFLCANNGGLK